MVDRRADRAARRRTRELLPDRRPRACGARMRTARRRRRAAHASTRASCARSSGRTRRGPGSISAAPAIRGWDGCTGSSRRRTELLVGSDHAAIFAARHRQAGRGPRLSRRDVARSPPAGPRGGRVAQHGRRARARARAGGVARAALAARGRPASRAACPRLPANRGTMPSSRWAAREAASDSVIDWATIVGADFAARGGPRRSRRRPRARAGSCDRPTSARCRRSYALDLASSRRASARISTSAARRARSTCCCASTVCRRVIDHQAGDMTVTVEAGCPLARLQERLAAAGQWLPLDPPHPDRTTLGGLVAANLSGPLRASQGTARDLLLGIAVVGADGALVRGGGRVVKNVAGYDLPKLHVGALGTVGVIVEAHVQGPPASRTRGRGGDRVPQRPRSRRGGARRPRRARSAVDRGCRLRRSRRRPGRRRRGGGGTRRPGGGGRARRGAGAGVRRGERLPRGDAGRCRGAARASRRSSTSSRPPRCCAPPRFPSRSDAVLEAAEAAARERGTAVRTLAHAANGIVRIAVLRPADVEPLLQRAPPAARIRRRLARGAARAAGGEGRRSTSGARPGPAPGSCAG